MTVNLFFRIISAISLFVLPVELIYSVILIANNTEIISKNLFITKDIFPENDSVYCLIFNFHCKNNLGMKYIDQREFISSLKTNISMTDKLVEIYFKRPDKVLRILQEFVDIPKNASIFDKYYKNIDFITEINHWIIIECVVPVIIVIIIASVVLIIPEQTN